MIAKILNGKVVASNVIKHIYKSVQKRIFDGKRVPGLAVIVIGNDIPSNIYIRNKINACNAVGFFSVVYTFSDTISDKELLILINKLNNDNKIDGILLQMPIPLHLNINEILSNIVPSKDVDGLHPYNIGRLLQYSPIFRPCTPQGIIFLLEWYKINLIGLHAVIIGTSNIVGKPMMIELLIAGCTVTMTNKSTKNLKKYIRIADIIIVAVGQKNLIPGSWIKLGAIVIDVGINYLNNGKIVGDVDFDSCIERASYITPVPGGVGPMTIAMLLKNTILSCENH